MQTVHQTLEVARRSVLRSLRAPGTIIPPFIFPLALFLVNSSGLAPAAHLPGFPDVPYVDFAFAVPFMQVALFATVIAGTDLARDIEGGFLQRLALTPLNAPALLFGQLAGAAAVGVLSGVLYMIVGLAIGVEIAGGVPGALVLLLLAACISLAFSAIGLWIALRTGTGEAVQGVFPLLFVAFFLSSINLPRDLIDADWFRYIATVNPVSYLLEGMRSIIIVGWDAQALALGFGFAALILLAALTASSFALRKRLVRT